jgi:serine/threonine-protein kinase
MDTGEKFGPYVVAGKLGEGGMGEVYRARDTKLNRDVAIKVLLAAVANDPERLARFRREAQTLASLNHSGIAQIYGIEDSSSGPFLVMELVEGPTLADRIAVGPIPVDEAITISRQIVDALEAAHERGIIHRDLKPANIKVRDDGAVKILDFGLAKALDPGAGNREPGTDANSPTITSPAMTQAGLILGTAAYMSPEQAKGRPVDKRTDVWAFGCVLYEMLTGKRAFGGEDVTDTIAAIVRGEPEWNVLPQDTPPQIRLLLKRCLDKDRRTRIGDISVARFLLDERVDSGPALEAAPAARSAPWLLAAGVVVGLTLGVIAAAVAGWALRTSPTPLPARFLYTPPAAQPLAIQGNDRDVVLAPDGSFLVYRTGLTATQQVSLMVRSMNELDGRPLAGTVPARSPAVSPDGRWVAFSAAGELRKVPIEGGPPTTICKLAGAIRGISWADDGHIIFAASQIFALQRVDADGGEPQQITKPADGVYHHQPFVLPGSRTVLFTSVARSVQTTTVEVLDLVTGAQKTVVNGGFDPGYFDPGYLVYVVSDQGRNLTSGSLRAVRFDERRLETVGDSVMVVDRLAVMATGIANYSISRSGGLVYIPSSSIEAQLIRRGLVWVDRKGQETPIPIETRGYEVARLSPDGGRVALDVRDQTNDIWVWDLARRTLTSLDRDLSQDMAPVWTPDGHRVLWTSTRGGTVPNLFWQSADGTGKVERLSINAGNQFPTSITPDGNQLLYFGSSQAQSLDIFTMDLRGNDRKPTPLISSSAAEMGPEISPDARWLAYHSNESGEYQVYVRPFPNVDDRRHQISTDGGTRPLWSRKGNELFYIDSRGLLNAVSVKVEGGKFAPGVPTVLLKTPYHYGYSRLGLDLRGYDIAPDGQRFLMIKDMDPGQAPTLAGMVIVLNWIEELKARLPEQ